MEGQNRIFAQFLIFHLNPYTRASFTISVATLTRWRCLMVEPGATLRLMSPVRSGALMTVMLFWAALTVYCLAYRSVSSRAVSVKSKSLFQGNLQGTSRALLGTPPFDANFTYIYLYISLKFP
jgi:hypothetical protein